jgi:uncharacterized membrane protein
VGSAILAFLATFLAGVVVGALLLAFGVQWLRKAVLRAAGYKPLHDEAAAFARERADAGSAPEAGSSRVDWYAFTVSFKGVLLGVGPVWRESSSS